jgi:hypothetical protein
MKKVYLAIVMAALVLLGSPALSLAVAPKIFTGSITKINGSQIIFMAGSAARYSADIANAVLMRKNGASMAFTEFLVGDKVEVKGTLWSDNSISATYIKDNSLYAHTGTFVGKITAINPTDSSFTLQSKTYGEQTIQTNNFTSFSKNGSNAGFSDMQLGMSVTAKGMWDRNQTQIVATKVDASFRLINIYFTGNLSMQNGNSLTVIGNGNVIYGVDITHAILQNKTGQPLLLTQLKTGDSLRVWGKHISGLVQITATKIKDSSVNK